MSSVIVDAETKKSLLSAGSDFIKNRPIAEILLVFGLGMIGYGLFKFLPDYGERMEQAHREERKDWKSTIERCLDLAGAPKRQGPAFAAPANNEVAGGK